MSVTTDSDFIMQMRPLFGQEEKDALAAYMDEDGFLTEFRYTAEFERSIASFTGSNFCFAVNNGTVALTLAGMAIGLKPGDEVIVPNYTMVATANAFRLIGCKIVFADIDPVTLCLDIEKVRSLISSRTKLIVLVAANGRFPYSGIEEFENLASEAGIYLIEDAAQALGSFYPDGRHVGKAGVISTFSFSAPKIISTGQGGALITDDEELAGRIKKLKDFGRASGGNDIHDTIGYNFKFTELQAVVGIEQMKKLPTRIQRKREIYQRYADNLKQYSQSASLIANDVEFTTPWFYEIVVDKKVELIAHLKKKGIGTREMYPPLNRQLAYNIEGNFPVSFDIGKRGLWLPSQVQLTNDEIDYICKNIGEFFV